MAVAISEVPNLDLKPGTRKGNRTAKYDGRIKICDACGTKHVASLRKCRKCQKVLPKIDPKTKTVSFAEKGDASVITRSSRTSFKDIDEESAISVSTIETVASEKSHRSFTSCSSLDMNDDISSDDASWGDETFTYEVQRVLLY